MTQSGYRRAPFSGLAYTDTMPLSLGADMRRREFFGALGGAVAAWPFAARAQPTAVPVIGLLTANLPGEASKVIGDAFHGGLRATGYIEGQSVVVELIATGRELNRLPAVAAELARRLVALIVALGTVPALAAKAATTTIPIVFVTGDDPVLRGLVASFNRPGGNVTGVTFVSATIAAKRLQLVRSLAPKAEFIGVLADAASPESQAQVADAQAASKKLGQAILVHNAANDGEIDAAFATFVQQKVGALLIAGGPFLYSRSARLAELAARHALPAMYPIRDFAMAGGLVSYGASIADAMQQGGVYAGRILRGDRPADLPVFQSTRFELVINGKTAHALGLDVPPMLLALADEVIE